MADDLGDKTEEPTDRKRSQTREKGNVARSQDLNTAGLLLAASASLKFLGPGLVEALVKVLRMFLAPRDWETVDAPLISKLLWEVFSLLATGILPFMIAMAAAALVLNLVQVGFFATTEPLIPKFSRLNPLEGAKRILSITGLVKLAVSIGKIAVVATIAGWFVTEQMGHFLETINFETGVFFSDIGASMVTLAFQLAAALVILAMLDYGFQLWKFNKDLMMTKQEVREEMKNMDGDPHIRQRRKEAHRKLATSQELRQVQEADVVVTNPTELAVAIKYDANNMDAPIVVAKGAGELAARIRQLAAQHGVPIVEKKPLAQALYKNIKPGQAVPVDLYEAVAEILAYVYRLNNKAAYAA
ncbi:Flagellar biosynthetic protein FlhB [Symmachiella dynata]|uniref:flagellar biosynthesis protein FlhB n=1 Tax=Symmachiella dynata TaxID=2527995 RepID=UPI00118C0B36|nr:flagellar biosynthesis protein FlhB [Symmachiella dynata]QDT46089.1 Flagellar biosynthetic protein FlhB [Symmachiella dynata]